LSNVFILDACALIAFLADETGSDKIEEIINDAIDNKIILKMNQINLLEVYYYVINFYGQNEANRALEKITEFPIEIKIGLNIGIFKEAGRIKSTYKIPLGDSIAVAECIIEEGTLITSDHTDFEKICSMENVKINWFR
jgi:predicted nucleic acid-binding protein